MLKDNNIIFINFHNRIPICFIKMIKIIYFLVCNCNFDYFVLTWCFLKNISIVFVCYWFFPWFFIIAARNIHKSIFIYIFKMFLNLILILNLTQMLSKCGFFAWIMPIFRVFVLKKFPFASWFMFKKMLKSFKNIYPWQFFLQFSTTILAKPHPFFFYYWNHQRLLNLFILHDKFVFLRIYNEKIQLKPLEIAIFALKLFILGMI